LVDSGAVTMESDVRGVDMTREHAFTFFLETCFTWPFLYSSVAIHKQTPSRIIHRHNLSVCSHWIQLHFTEQDCTSTAATAQTSAREANTKLYHLLTKSNPWQSLKFHNSLLETRLFTCNHVWYTARQIYQLK